MNNKSPYCLSGIRVLDLSRVLALPYATMILGDLGAEVIKVEKPGKGDDTRSWGPPYFGTESAYYLCANRNKKSITVDIKSAEGQKVIKDLAAKSDIVVENFKVGELKKYGLNYESLSKINSKLIYCSLTGFGQNGPKSKLPGYDFMIQGISGIMSITGESDREPMKVGVAIVDIVAGLYAVTAILASLYKRDKSGKGEYIDIALFDTAASWLSNVGSNYLVSGKIPERFGNAHPNIVPYQTFKAKDEYFNLAIGNDAQWERFATILGNSKFKREQFKTNADRVRNRKELIALLKPIFLRKNVSEWIKILEKESIPSGKILTLDKVFSDAQLNFRNMIQTVKHPFGKLKLVGSPIKLKNHPIKQPTYPPTLGEHTDYVLKTVLEYSKTDK